MQLKKIAALYIRVSTHEQEELSPDSQIKLCLDYASNNGYFVPEEYIFRDDGISGRKTKNRLQFQRLIALAKDKSHPIDSIIVWKFSRFARNQEESIVYKSLLAKNNVSVVSISEPIIDGPFGSLIERIIEWFDEYYSINLSTEVKRGMTENAMRGNYQGDAPIGYTSPGNGNPPIKNPETIEIYRIARSLLMKRTPLRQIASTLNNSGYRSKRGNPFDNRSVKYMLENPFYAGKNRWNYTGRGRSLKDPDEVIYSDGNWEPEITYEEFEENLKILKELAGNSSVKKRDVSTTKHWLSGLVKCPQCGRSFAYMSASKGFNCWGYSKGVCDTSSYVGQSKLESYVLEALKDLLKSDTLCYEVVPVGSVDADERIANLNGILAQIDSQLIRAKKAYMSGIDTIEEYAANKKELLSNRKDIEKNLVKLKLNAIPPDKDQTDQIMLTRIEDVLLTLSDASKNNTEKGNAIRSIVDHMTFSKTTKSLEMYLKLNL